MTTAALVRAVVQPTATGGVTADFSDETWWLSVIKAVFIVLFLIVSVIMVLWVERRGLARMQVRRGPNVNGPLGLLQAVADAAKLILKEDFWLKGAEKFIYILAPVIAAFCAFMVYAVIPFGPEVSILGHVTPLQLADFPVAVLYILAVTAFGVYGIILGGWSSHSTYPLLGAVRSAAQVISYELAMSLSMLTVFLASGTMSTSGIVSAQERLWWGLAMLPSLVIYVVSMIGEVNRLPFDLPEAEGELVAGHMVEYSSMKFAWYFLAEYINMFNVSAVCVTLFLGGWRSFILASFWDGANSGWWPLLWFVLKVWAVMFFMIWTRGTLVRIRYDHFMKLGWKVLIPVSLAWFVLVAVVQAYRSFTDGSTQGLLGVLAAIFLVAMLILFFAPAAPEEDEDGEPEDQWDDDELIAPGEGDHLLAGGFPVPPLPGQTLPPSPRARRAEPVPASGGGAAALGLQQVDGAEGAMAAPAAVPSVISDIAASLTIHATGADAPGSTTIHPDAAAPADGAQEDNDD
ncbi:MAG: NADH-quinone oxidoreductase subunit NuoH [Actinomyces sp.]|uniref:NADH-quinone oxidoreductase subunit NuoH n=1 Tax=Actinomyces sp. TaxID=29317 RepID=UPI0026DB6C89|nr:NADH-quinone oxidoreductase subunit NuoH [Actinomyces sp.]MDO4242176.1 NADH-quinone oxidoreductase subunit NuoH [Actinomyces sp.]